jgi:hypothetical protein
VERFGGVAAGARVVARSPAAEMRTGAGCKRCRESPSVRSQDA